MATSKYSVTSFNYCLSITKGDKWPINLLHSTSSINLHHQQPLDITVLFIWHYRPIFSPFKTLFILFSVKSINIPKFTKSSFFLLTISQQVENPLILTVQFYETAVKQSKVWFQDSLVFWLLKLYNIKQ